MTTVALVILLPHSSNSLSSQTENLDCNIAEQEKFCPNSIQGEVFKMILDEPSIVEKEKFFTLLCIETNRFSKKDMTLKNISETVQGNTFTSLLNSSKKKNITLRVKSSIKILFHGDT